MSIVQTLTEKRFFEWHPDNESVTLRNNGGSYGGGERSIGNLLPKEVGALCADLSKGISNQIVYGGQIIVYETQTSNEEYEYIARRITPTEAERLQGFPDGWTNPFDDGKWTDSKGKRRKVSDGPRFRAIGNSIGIPCWIYIMRGISKVLRDDGIDNPRLGSLFDGIGGFPMIWEHINGKGSAIWASEIEEFCIAITKKHFPEEKTDETN